MLNPDQNIDHFKIIRKLGEGGMGEVYLAEDQKLARKVALKVLPYDLLEDKDRLDRFYREARIAAKISHPNVMAIYDFGTCRPEGTDKDLKYIVMEYIEGESLRDYLSRRTITMSDRLRISERISRGLSAAHKLNIVHRDIKTSNIMVDGEGEPKILDFGLAKPIDTVFPGDTTIDTITASQDLTQDGKILGTATYMSPEQARGETVDARSDIFSFGVMMYKVFSGEYPFEGGDRVSTMAKILETKHIPIREKNSTLPTELERIIDKCLQKSPDDRYQDSRDLVVDLRTLRRQYESGITESTSIEMDAYRKKKKISLKSKLAYSLAAIVLIAAIITIIIDSSDTTGPYTLQAKEDALAILGFENKTGDPELDWLKSGLPEILLTDLAQSGGGKIISRNRVLDCLTDRLGSITDLPRHQDCVEAAKSLGASTVLSGSFFKLGDKIRIDARLEDIATGKILFGEKVIGEDPFILVDSLTQKIALSLNSQEMVQNNIEVADITSSSPEAYKYYIMGMDKYYTGRYDDANAEFQKAIELDSTFALPYMRIGIGYALQSRGQQGVPYFKKAQKYQDRLPIKDRNLLDIYANVFLDRKYDDAMVKMESFVANYPEDKEARSFYAIFLSELKRNNQAALYQLDTVMMLDTRYMPALEMYIEIHSRLEEYDKSVEYALRMKEYYPESPAPYQILSGLYRVMANYDETINISKELLEKFPNHRRAPITLALAYIIKRDFEKASSYVELLKERHGDDPYQMSDYYDYRARLDIWKGRFNSAIANLKQSGLYAVETGDSLRIMRQLYDVSEYYFEFGQPDSAIAYAEMAYKWTPERLILNYPLMLIEYGPEYEDKARPYLEEGIKNLKATFPQELWGLLDLLEESFNSQVRSDTSGMIDNLKALADKYDQGGTENSEELGRLLVLSGRYEEGLETLNRITTGLDQTANGFYYIRSMYYIGMANEALGNTARAISAYEEIIRFWNKADIELDFVSDTRQRLARLTS